MCPGMSHPTRREVFSMVGKIPHLLNQVTKENDLKEVFG
jgi:hypothetical protein